LANRNLDAVIEQWLEHERATPFDLTSGLLLRAKLLAVDHQHHMLLINHHHIASDGWSCSLLAQDLSHLYNAQCSGDSPLLTPLSVHYQDYTAWQLQRLSGARLKKLKDYWIPQLSALEPLQLPTDFPRPPSPSYRGDAVSLLIAPELLAPFQQLCQQEGATLQMGLLALLTLLLHRHSRQDDIAIGMPIWGRTHPDLETLVGCFINTLPIRTQTQPQQSFRQLLLHVKATSLAAYDHQELPFEQMVEALQLPRDTSRNPLVQVMLQLIELPDVSLNNLDGLAIDTIPLQAQTSHLDLSFTLQRSPDYGLTGSITYATDLFLKTRIERLAAQFICLLTAAVQEPDLAVAHLNLLPDSERKLLEVWQHGPSLTIPNLGLHQLFEQQVERTPAAIALISGDQQLSYQQLNARANQLAHQLIALGVGPNQFVGICLERCLEMVVALLAILKAGGAYVALDPAYPEQRLAFMVQDSKPTVVVVHQATRDRIASMSSGMSTLDLDADRESWSARSSRNPDPAVLGLAPDQLAYLIYTSGSTGQPKGVMVEHRSAVNFITWAGSEFPLDLVQRTLFATSINFDLAVYECFLPLAAGGACVIVPNALQAGSILAEVSLINTVPAVMNSLLRTNTLPENVRGVNLAGEPLSHDLAEALFRGSSIEELRNLYGPTETTTYSTSATFKRGQGFATHIGRPIANTHIYLLDEQVQPVPIGVSGQLYIGGAGVCRGYLNRSELTAQRFLPDPFAAEQGARMYNTGDLARWRPDGNLEFHGRSDFQIKLRGFRIEFGEIEALLRHCQGVDQAVVSLKEDNAGEQHLVAFLTGTPAGPSELRSALAASLPQHMLPDAFVVLPSLPLTSNGKVDRMALPTPSFEGNLKPGAAPSSERERQLLALWSQVLGHSSFGVEDNFFQIGGHSLAAAQLAALADRHWPNELSVARIFLHPTIDQQSNFLAGRPANQQPANLVSLQSKGDRPPLYLTHGWGGGVGNFVGLARALTPNRPVFGLQASAYLLGQLDGPREPVRVMAASYAKQILERHGEGPIHLMGFSAGGWYAFAVAEALLERGASIGMLAILDTHASARIQRSLGLRLLAYQAKEGLVPTLKALMAPPAGQGRLQILLDQLRNMNGQLDTHLGLRLPSPYRLLYKALNRSTTGLDSDAYIRWIRKDYRPPRLPLTVDLFATPTSRHYLQRLWSFYAMAGVRSHLLFTNHLDFMGVEGMPDLAAALETAMEPLERR
ncbi:MAG: amino acid adenylation domain-containing protein, partial [Synechococcaceae cyanobacterium]|nr:amino acid adenylation domain-containing protein [Synechococcaceae cyanobacterium]